MSNVLPYYVSPDFNHNQLLNVRIQNLASAPSSPAEGWVYYDTSDHTFRGWNNSSWVNLGGSGGSSSPLTTKGDIWGYSTTDARFPIGVTNKMVLQVNSAATFGFDWVIADHTYISDFDTQVRTSRLDQMAAPSGSVSLNSQKITSLQSGTASTDAVNKGQLDAATQGLTGVKDPVRVIATTNGTLATAYENGDTVDGVTLATGDRILLAGQTSASENGIYTVNASGAPTRAVDADASGEIKVGTYIYVQAGTAGAGTQWVVSATGANPWVPGSSTSTWTFFFQATATQAGPGLTAPGGNTLAVGAGTGIVVNANDVATDPAVTPRGASTTFGNASATTFTWTHNLGSKKLVLMFRDTISDDGVIIAWHHNSTNQLAFDTGAFVPASGQIEVTAFAIT